jgi:uncharacterized protein YndB with AHSA1/START domain
MEAVMAFPDRIERTVEIAHPPTRVWAALTTAEGLSAWFGNEATIDLRPGGSASMKWDSGTAYDGNTRGWASELGELADYLDAVA